MAKKDDSLKGVRIKVTRSGGMSVPNDRHYPAGSIFEVGVAHKRYEAAILHALECGDCEFPLDDEEPKVAKDLHAEPQLVLKPKGSDEDGGALMPR